MGKIGYHTRLYSDNTKKICGGTFSGSVCMETADRLSKLFKVTIKPGGTPVFVDSAGREVRLYMSVDPSSTTIGQDALMGWREKRNMQRAKEEERSKKEQDEINQLMEGLSHEDLIRRLRG